MSVPTNTEILTLLDRLETCVADELETQWFDFKPWRDPKEDKQVAVEMAVSFANAEGGVVVFGVADGLRGRALAIHGARRYDVNSWRTSIFESTRPNLPVEVSELPVPEGTGMLLVVRVPRGEAEHAYGTSDGTYKIRIGKSCMPLDPARFVQRRMASGAIDWSGETTDDDPETVLDPTEIARARNVLRKTNPDSELLRAKDPEFLIGLGAVRSGRPTHAGLLLFARETALRDRLPQHQVHYVYQTSDTAVARNDSFRFGLLQTLDRIEQAFSGPANPEYELTVGLFRLRIPAFPFEAVREAVLNAVTHRDYQNPGEVLVRHSPRELVVSSPGGFIAGITPDNILRHEPASRNRTLAEAFEKLRLVERAGMGRRRIFVNLLRYGKRMPAYESGPDHVTLHIYDGSFDERTARLVAKWSGEGREIDLDSLLVLSYLRSNAFIDTYSAAGLLQLPRDGAKALLDTLALPYTGLLDRRGRTKAATYHLTKGVARDLLGRAAYTRTRGLDPLRYAELVKQFVSDHGEITPRECRELLGLGESQSARVEVSRYLRKWSGKNGFLVRIGKPPRVKYVPPEALARESGLRPGRSPSS